MQLSRALINALLPPGSVWTPEDDEGLDALLDGMAANVAPLREFLGSLANIRNPLSTQILPDLEREYGIIPDSAIDEAVRRQRLAAVISARAGNGGLNYLQDRLQQAGFNLYVHENNPPVNPALFLLFGGSAITGNPSAMFGKQGIQFGTKRGELVANGPVHNAQALVKYTLPTDPVYWPLVFFVGGAATRNEAGELTGIADAPVPSYRKGELIRLIVKYKPLHSWAGLMAKYIQ